MAEDVPAVVKRMRRDWDARAAKDAEYYVRTPEAEEKEVAFDESGRLNIEQFVQPDFPLLLDDRPPAECAMLEIGCGVGRMTRWFSRLFREVWAVDISPVMIEQARLRLADCPNVTLRVGTGSDLAELPDSYFDFAFSYIVFQHIPSRAVIESYVKEVHRVLKPGGAFKFQLQGYCSREYRETPKDSWLGESFSFSEAEQMIRRAGLSPVAADGSGTQYFVLTARKPRSSPDSLARDLCDLEIWGQCQLSEIQRLEGSITRAEEQASSREVAPRSSSTPPK